MKNVFAVTMILALVAGVFMFNVDEQTEVAQW